MQPPKWPGLGFPIGTTPFQWFCAGPQGPAMNDDNMDTYSNEPKVGAMVVAYSKVD